MKFNHPEKNNQLVWKSLIGLVVLFVLVFVGFKLYPIVHGPAISIDTLVNGGTVEEPMVRISGIASFTRELIVNGESFALSPSGGFDEKLLLNPGYNIITVQGVDRYGKANNQNYAIVLKEKNPPETLTLNTLPVTYP